MPRRNDPEVYAKRRKALELRLAGHTYASIATQTGYTQEGHAYKAVKEALKETIREPADEVRAIEVQRLDELMLAHWKKAQTGNLDSFDRILKLMKRRAELLGLDAPKQLQFSGDAEKPVVYKVVEKIVDAEDVVDKPPLIVENDETGAGS